MKTRLLIIIGIAVAIAILFYVSLVMQVIFIHTEPDMSLEEFHERFDGEDIVKHFKSTYPEHISGRGKSPGMIMPAWGYASLNGSSIAELRVEKNFGKYEFVYTCGDLRNNWNPQVKIQNPLPHDIDGNRCW
jgi:hypothetical protein